MLSIFSHMTKIRNHSPSTATPLRLYSCTRFPAFLPPYLSTFISLLLHYHPTTPITPPPPHFPASSFTSTYSCTTSGFLDQVSAVFDLIQVIVYPSILTCNTMTHVARSLQYADVRCAVRRSHPHPSHSRSLTRPLTLTHSHFPLSFSLHSIV